MANLTNVDQELKQKANKQLMNATDPLEKIKLTLLKRGGSGIKNLARGFRIMDDDRNQKLNFEEFKTGMSDFLGAKGITETEMRDVFAKFDDDGSQTINVQEFLIKMQPKMSQNRMNLVSQAFTKFDVSGDGFITTKDLDSYDVSQHPKYKNGEWTQKQCLGEFLTSFDDKKHADGKVTKDEFIAYYSAISCSIDNDAYFDLMMRQAWNLD